MESEARALRPPKKSSDRTFGLVFGALFLVVALVPLVRGGTVRVWAIIFSALLCLIALLRPILLQPFNRAWLLFGNVLHRITSPIVLGAMFFGVITPVGFVRRRAARDPMRLRLDPHAATYWIERTPPGPDAGSFTRQF